MQLNKKNKRVLLCALNSKYIHTCLAIRYIKAYADKHCEDADFNLLEETINEKWQKVLSKILAQEPDIVAFSCYIWNIDMVLLLCSEIKKALKNVLIILGGPEVSFNPKDYLEKDCIDYVLCGDGEAPMTALVRGVANNEKIFPENMGICGKNNGHIFVSAPYCQKNLDSLESPYTDEYLQAVKGRIAYIETTRGCPFSCAFCLSGATKGVLSFDMDYVKKAILDLWKSGAKTIKFIDRTFNADKHRAQQIISFIIDNYKSFTEKVCFHFEIAADILDGETIELLKKSPRGLFQIEAGLQSFNPHTLEAVTRKTDTEKVCRNIKKLLENGNIHTHIDLIAGLPYEDLESFKDSFDRAYKVGADVLQLGFLKLLKGSSLNEKAEEMGLFCKKTAPYEIVYTKWLTQQQMDIIRGVEDANEKISNSGRFLGTLKYIFDKTNISPFKLFSGFGKKPSMSLDDYTALVYEYFIGIKGVDKDVIRDKMCVDRLKSNSSGRLPDCLKKQDKNLAKYTYILEQNKTTAKKKGVKRAVCILYTEKKVVYADYTQNNCDEQNLKYISFDEIANMQTAVK